MHNRAIYLLVVEGFADWEPAHAVAELRRHGGYRVERVGLDRNPVISMGGLRITPSRTIDELDIDDVAAFILPGGDRWENMPVEAELESALKQLDARKVPIAAICAATVAISRVGLLRGRQHTSKGLSYLQSHVPDYNEAQNYVAAPAVRDHALSQPADSETLSLRANSSRS
jgi:putative intracellular protease/amidase